LKNFQQKGASFDYNEYIPHLILCYDLPYDINPRELFEQVKDLEIVFDKIRFEEINEEKYLKKLNFHLTFFLKNVIIII
jgi:hypothetical protein